MNNAKLLSIIIPTYNLENYIEQCLDSLFDGIPDEDAKLAEVIVVDDGSTDRTPEILKNYRHAGRQVDFPLIVIEQKNGGPYLARNVGLRAAQGKYVYFVDGDDYIIPSAFPRVLNFLRENDVDILDFEACTFFEKTGETEFKKRQYPITSGTGQEIFVAWERAKLMENECWRRIFRHSLITDNDVYFMETSEGADEEWTPRVFSYAGRVVHLPLCIYVYRRRESSITQLPPRRRTFTNLIKYCDSLIEFSKSPHLSPEFRKTLFGVISYIYWRTFRGIKIDGRFDDELISEIERRFYLMDYNVKFSRRYLYRPFIRTFGLKAFYALKYWNRGK